MFVIIENSDHLEVLICMLAGRMNKLRGNEIISTTPPFCHRKEDHEPRTLQDQVKAHLVGVVPHPTVHAADIMLRWPASLAMLEHRTTLINLQGDEIDAGSVGRKAIIGRSVLSINN